MRTTDDGKKSDPVATAVSPSAGETAPSGERFDAFICYKRTPADERFVDHLCQVTQALEDDLDWRDEHTYLGARAGQWDGQQRKRGFLLHGEELRSAEEWLVQAALHPKVPPSQLHLDYIAAGRKDANQVRNRWIARLSVGLVISLVLASVAFVQWQAARTDARIATARALAAESSADLSSNPQQSLSCPGPALWAGR